VKVTFQAVHAEQSADLRPVASFMQQDMDNEFPGRGSHKIIHEIEILRDIPILSRKLFYEFRQIRTALAAKLKEGFDVVIEAVSVSGRLERRST